MTSPGKPMTVRAARWSATHPVRAVAGWLALVVLCLVGGSVAGLRQADDRQVLDGRSAVAANWLHDSGLQEPDTEHVLVTARTGTLDLAAADRALADATGRLSALPGVAGVGPVTTSPDGTAAMVTATLPQGDDPSVSPLLAATRQTQAAHPDLRVEEVGSASLDKAVNDQVGSDLGRAGLFSFPITLVIMMVAFGAVVAAGVPLLLGLSAVGAATGLASLVSHLIPDSGSTSSVILMIGMAVGVDYSLFFLTRVRAELRAGNAGIDAVEVAASTSGHSVVVSGGAVAVSMAGLFLAGNVVFRLARGRRDHGRRRGGARLLTVLPALLVLLGRRITPRAARGGAFWQAVVRPVIGHPRASLAAAVALLGALALPALSLHLESDSAKSLPASIAETASLHRLTAAFPGESTDLQVVVRAPAAERSAVASGLRALGPVDASPDGTVHAVTVGLSLDPESPAAKRAVTGLRREAGELASRIPEAHAAVAGEAAADLDSDGKLSARLPWVVAAVLAGTTLMMLLVFRSVRIALLTAGANLLSAGASFGVLTLVFQHHWFDGLLGYHSTGALINWIPLFTFAVLTGLSMDYHVFVLSAVREEGDVARGVVRSAGVITSAALVMVSVFGVFALLHMVEMKELGLGLAVAVLLDAAVVRLVVLPSALSLLGPAALGTGGRREPPVGVTALRPTREAGAGAGARELSGSLR